ncbi:MAG: beta strand repeat-containing protein, partial [Thermoguttaceae bacterium]
MKTMNGITSELLVRKAKRNWRTRCGAFLLAILAAWHGGFQQNANAEVVLNIDPAALGQAPGIVYDFAPTNNVGGPGAAAHTQFYWNTPGNFGGNNLNALLAGITVNTIQTSAPLPNPNNPVPRILSAGGGGGNLQVNGLDFINAGSQVNFTSDMTWWPDRFAVNGGANGTVVAGGGVLNLRNTLNVGGNGTLNINKPTGGNYTTSAVAVNGGTNSGTININQAELNHYALDGGGTIRIDQWGMLNIYGGTVNNNIVGQYVGTGTSVDRGKIMALNPFTNVNGTVTGQVAVDGGGTLRFHNNNTGLNSLFVMGNSEIVIDRADQLGNATLTLGNLNGSGQLTKHRDAGVLSISNSITIGQPGVSSGVGGFNANGTVVGWTQNADSTYDMGNRFIIDGTITSAYTNSMIHINEVGGIGTVVLTANNESYNGGYQIFNGQLEVRNEANLGAHGGATHGDLNRVIVGSGGATQIRSAFRVNGAAGTQTEIVRFIEMANSDSSFYEVFTDGTPGSRAGLSDSARFKVVQSGVISGSGALNKAGDGVLVLAANVNSYTGNTVIHHGVLSISGANQINDKSTSAKIVIGSLDYQTDSFRPVFETTLGTDVGSRPASGVITIQNAKVVINQVDSVFRTTGLGNETILARDVITDPLTGATFVPTLNKQGAGTLTLQGNGLWGYNNTGALNIQQGTVQISAAKALATGAVTIGLDPLNPAVKDIELTDAKTGLPVNYKATLKLSDNLGQVAMPNNVFLGHATAAFVEAGINSNLVITGVVGQVAGVTADLNKTGLGTVTLGATSNTYGGWTNVTQGTLATTSANNMVTSAGVDLIGAASIFDMSAAGANQTLNGLRGGDVATDPSLDITDPTTWNRQVNIGANTLTLNQTQFKTTDAPLSQTLYGNIVGTGTLVKSGLTGSTFAAGFGATDAAGKPLFTGAFNIQAGTLQTLTDATITGLSGKAGTYLDIQDKTLTINNAVNQAYQGLIVSSSNPVGQGTIVKQGVGTLTSGFYNRDTDTGAVAAFQGNLT